MADGSPAAGGTSVLVEHTGELELRLRGPSLAAVYAQALRALADELVEHSGEGPRERRPVELSSSGPDTLLADLLNEAIFLEETEGFVADGLEVAELEGGRLRGALVGSMHEQARPVVKAATYHGLEVREDGEGWTASVVLDV
jgi:SHS2 domain-containing protein